MEFSEYKKLQEEGSAWSFGNNWGNQMEDAILSYLSMVNKNSAILDVGCGEGRGLLALENLGFTNLYGVDISTPKILKAKEAGLEVEECDFHSMEQFADKQFDFLFCSHAVEHSLDPKKVIKECLRISKNGMFIVPIDGSLQPPLGQSPHTHNFFNHAQWMGLFNDIACRNYSHEFKNRIGQEIWTKWYEN